MHSMWSSNRWSCTLAIGDAYIHDWWSTLQSVLLQAIFTAGEIWTQPWVVVFTFQSSGRAIISRPLLAVFFIFMTPSPIAKLITDRESPSPITKSITACKSPSPIKKLITDCKYALSLIAKLITNRESPSPIAKSITDKKVHRRYRESASPIAKLITDREYASPIAKLITDRE